MNADITTSASRSGIGRARGWSADRDSLFSQSRTACVAWFAGGHFMLPNEFIHLGGLLFLAVLASLLQRFERSQVREMDTAFWMVVAFLTWMTMRSLIWPPLDFALIKHEVIRGLLGLVLLAALALMVWCVAHSEAQRNRVGWIACGCAVVAAFTSVAGVRAPLLMELGSDVRLSNPLVHGGLNAVCTGLTFGFAAVWLSGLQQCTLSVALRRWLGLAVFLLNVCVFATGSRAAILALCVGHATHLIAAGIPKARAGLIQLAAAAMLVLAVLPGLERWFYTVETSPAPHVVVQLIERGDSGRWEIYQAGWSVLTNFVAGTGQWGARDRWICGLQNHCGELMGHLHSAWFATLIHGGVIGLLLLAGVLALAFKRALRMSFAGEHLWLSLMAYGCTGLLFDGESLTSLATGPRFEGLLFWLPAMMALSAGRERVPSSGNQKR